MEEAQAMTTLERVEEIIRRNGKRMEYLRNRFLVEMAYHAPFGLTLSREAPVGEYTATDLATGTSLDNTWLARFVNRLEATQTIEHLVQERLILPFSDSTHKYTSYIHLTRAGFEKGQRNVDVLNTHEPEV